MKIVGLALMGAVTAALVCIPAISVIGCAILAGSETTLDPTMVTSLHWAFAAEGTNTPYDYEYCCFYASEDGCDCEQWCSDRLDVLAEKDRFFL